MKRERKKEKERISSDIVVNWHTCKPGKIFGSWKNKRCSIDPTKGSI